MSQSFAVNPNEILVGIWHHSRWRLAFWLKTILTLSIYYFTVHKHNYIAVTNMTVTQKRGTILSGNETTMRVDQITDINLNQSMLGGIFNYGDITIQSAGSGAAEISMHGIANPRKLREVLVDLRDGKLDMVKPK